MPVKRFQLASNTVINYERLQKQAQARLSFERFLPRHVVDKILRSPNEVKLGGVRQKVTALFVDIRGFTTLSETRAPEQIVISENTMQSLDESFTLKPLGTERLKGKNVNLRIAEVVWQ